MSSLPETVLHRHIVKYHGRYYEAHQLICGYVLHQAPGQRVYVAASDPALQVLGRSSEYEAGPVEVQGARSQKACLWDCGGDSDALERWADTSEQASQQLEALRPALDALQDYLDAHEADVYAAILEQLPASATAHELFA